MQNTDGAKIYQPLYSCLFSKDNAARVITAYKGQNKDEDEYSIFSENNTAGKHLKELIENMFAQDKETYVSFAGIAGDVCVMNTLKDALKFIPYDHMKVFINFQASIDGDSRTLINFCRENLIELA